VRPENERASLERVRRLICEALALVDENDPASADLRQALKALDRHQLAADGSR
jgi:hypothetical protein